MAKTPLIKRIAMEDYSELPAEMKQPFEKLVGQLNMFFISVFNAMDGGLTFGDNVTGQWKQFTVTAPAAGNTTYLFLTDVYSPRGVSIEKIHDITTGTYTPISASVSLSWTIYTANNLKQIFIENITGLTANHKYDITVLVKG